MLEDRADRVVSLPHADAAAVATAHPSLIILDITPDQRTTALQLVEMLQSAVSARPVPMLVLSTDVKLLQELCAPLGARGCLVLRKPFELDEFHSHVARSLQAHGRPARPT